MLKMTKEVDCLTRVSQERSSLGEGLVPRTD
jgi:hypothetical protein